MPITGAPLAPGSAPSDGTQWVLYRNILLHSLASPANINTAAANNETTYTVGNNGPIPAITGATEFALARLYFAQFNVYADAAQIAVMAVDWPTWPGNNSPAAFSHAKIDGGDFTVSINPAVGGQLYWPLLLSFTWTCTVADGAVTYSAELIQVRADVWAGLPATSRLPRLNPTSPTLDPDKAGLELTWSRRNARVPRAPHALGEVAALTWPPMWDGPKRFLLDGRHLQVDALPSGGYTVQGDWYFQRIPGDPDITVAPPPSETGVSHVARFDVDLFDDGNAHLS